MLPDVRKRVRKTVFKKGVKPYIMMLIVILIFSFLSAFYSLGTKEVKTLDDKMSVDMVEKADVDDVESYIVSMSVFVCRVAVGTFNQSVRGYQICEQRLPVWPMAFCVRTCCDHFNRCAQQV